MSKDFVITAENNQKEFRHDVLKENAVTYRFDFTPWVEFNNTVSSVVWNVESGQGVITGEALASNVASALVTFPEEGQTRIKLTATTATEVYVTQLNVKVTDPNTIELLGDYQ